MTKLEREIRRREQRRLADLNRNNIEVFKVMLKISLVALAIIAGITIWFWAAAQQAMEVEAAVLRAHRITDGPLYGPGEIPLVEPLPLTPPEDGEPPQAIEIRTASKADPVPEEQEEWVSLGTFRCTAFCGCRKCNGKWTGQPTASGVMPEEGVTVAVDKSLIPFFTELKIDGVGVRVAHDTGKHIYGKRIDVFINDHQRASDFGVQFHEVYVRRR